MEIKAKLSFLFYFLLFIFSLIFVDRLVFEKLFFQIPNYLEWDTSPWYNFLSKRKQIEFSEKKDGILLVGSSVALYSALPKKIEKNLNSPSKSSFKAEFYAHVALSPTDFHYYLKDIIAKKPKYVIYLLNPADLQFDHIKQRDGKLIFSESEKLEIYPKRALVKNIYPFEYLKDNFTRLSKKNLLSLLSHSFLTVNRYKSFVKDPINSYMERNFRSGRSYHYYTGVVPKEGIWLKGWTPASFTMICEKKVISDSIFVQKPNTTVTILNDDKKQIFQRTFSKKSWYKIHLKQSSPSYFFKVSPASNSKEIEPRLFAKQYEWGIRLSQNFCKKNHNTNIAYKRILGLDDSRFLQMSLTEYKKYYFERLYPKSDKGNFLSRLKMIRDMKMKLNHSDFFQWSELKFISKVAETLHQNNIKFLIINNPENSIELSLYQSGKWYKGYLQFLKGLEKKDSVFFVDRKDFLQDMRYFMDPHHLTYQGSEIFSDEISEIFLNKFNL